MKGGQWVACALALAMSAASAASQTVDPHCADPQIVGPGQVGGDACQKTVDTYTYINAQLGTLIAGGNATLGQGGTLGGLGHFAAELRANGMRADLPDFRTTPLVTGPASSPSRIPVAHQFAVVPVLDGAIGVFRGFPVGLANVGGIDLLVNVAYLPDVSTADVRVKTQGSALKLGYGARLGILQESFLTPGISVTYFRRDLPTTSITARSGSNSLSVRDFDLRTDAWRVVINKNLPVVGLALGGGQDFYKADANLSYAVNSIVPIGGTFPVSVRPTRTNLFADVSLNLLAMKVVGEIGRVSGGDITTFNTFDPRASAARIYGTLGLRIGL